MKTRLLLLLCVLCSVTGYAQYTLQAEDVVIDEYKGIVRTTAVFNRKGHKDIVIPAKIGTQEVTGIRPYAFASLGLTRVDMKEGKITNIGRAAFSKNEISEVLFSEGTVTYLIFMKRFSKTIS